MDVNIVAIYNWEGSAQMWFSIKIESNEISNVIARMYMDASGMDVSPGNVINYIFIWMYMTVMNVIMCVSVCACVCLCVRESLPLTKT